MEDPVYLGDEHVLSRMLASETRQEMDSYFESGLQTDFNENDRRELAIWMRDVCIVEECQPDVFPLSMLIVDRFLTFVRTKRRQLQLLGSVALLLASKLRQTTQISTRVLIYYTQDLVTLAELRTWEVFVLTTLKWDIALITPVDYLDIFIKRMKLTDEQMISDIEEDAQNMIVECCLEFRYSLYPPSIIAWACLMRAMETWQLTAEHLHLTTSVVAREANNFMMSFSSQAKSATKSVKHRHHRSHHHPYHKTIHNHHHHHHHHNHHHHRSSSGDLDDADGANQSPSSVLSSCGDSYAGHTDGESNDSDGGINDGPQSMIPNDLNHFRLRANLAALDWI